MSKSKQDMCTGGHSAAFKNCPALVKERKIIFKNNVANRTQANFASQQKRQIAETFTEPNIVIELKEEIRALQLNLSTIKEKEEANGKKIDDLIAFIYNSGALRLNAVVDYLVEAYGAKGNRKDFNITSKIPNPLDHVSTLESSDSQSVNKSSK